MSRKKEYIKIFLKKHVHVNVKERSNVQNVNIQCVGVRDVLLW